MNTLKIKDLPPQLDNCRVLFILLSEATEFHTSVELKWHNSNWTQFSNSYDYFTHEGKIYHRVDNAGVNIGSKANCVVLKEINAVALDIENYKEVQLEPLYPTA